MVMKRPMGLGYVEGVTHDYYRHRTTTLFAALNVLDGAVITQCKPRHRHQEFVAFLNHLDHHVPADLTVHLIADNYATHKHPRVKAWLARHPRFHIHYTPTYASWLNQVERWFALISHQAIRLRSATCVSWSKRSMPTSPTTTPTNAPSPGPLPPTQFSPSSNVFVKLFTGHDTSQQPCSGTAPKKGEREEVEDVSAGVCQ